MTLEEMKRKALVLIEEYAPDSEYLTDDPDYQAKINDVIDQRMFELARYKKIPKYVEFDVSEGDLITFHDLERESGYVVYQVGKIGGVRYSPKASDTVFKMLESGKAEFDIFVFPEHITDKTKDKAYEFELSDDVLEIMPYGIAADLLKSDVSAEYGNVYAATYESMKQMLDPRYTAGTIFFDGGFKI